MCTIWCNNKNPLDNHTVPLDNIPPDNLMPHQTKNLRQYPPGQQALDNNNQETISR